MSVKVSRRRCRTNAVMWPHNEHEAPLQMGAAGCAQVASDSQLSVSPPPPTLYVVRQSGWATLIKAHSPGHPAVMYTHSRGWALKTCHNKKWGTRTPPLPPGVVEALPMVGSQKYIFPMHHMQRLVDHGLFTPDYGLMSKSHVPTLHDSHAKVFDIAFANG